jgi:hypothetical protein
LGRSRRRFGAPLARCGKCGAVFRTGLIDWTGLSQGAKARALVKELFLPTYLGKNVIYFYMFLAVALFLTVTGYDVWTLLSVLVIGVGLAAIGLLLTWRDVRESSAYARDGVLPIKGGTKKYEYECLACGAPLLESDEVCPSCGASLLEALEKENA